MPQSKTLHPSYITDESGKRVSVVLPLAEYEELLEDLEDLAMVAERRAEGVEEHSAVLERLKSDGLL